MTALPAKALSIMQPWAALIVHGVKDIENRGWRTDYRGPVLIHAGKRWDDDAQDAVDSYQHPVIGGDLELPDGITFPTGGIVGCAEIVDCVSASTSPWFVGEFGFILRDARPLPFMACRGKLGFFVPDFSPTPPPAKKPGPKTDVFRA